MEEQRTVLIIDDEQAHRLMIRLHLSEAGYRVLEAANGREGLDLAQAEQVDLVLLDIRMPVLGGQETLVQLMALEP